MPSDVRRLSARTLGDGVALLAGLELGAVGLGGLGQETVGLSHLLNLLDEVSNCTQRTGHIHMDSTTSFHGHTLSRYKLEPHARGLRAA